MVNPPADEGLKHCEAGPWVDQKEPELHSTIQVSYPAATLWFRNSIRRPKDVSAIQDCSKGTIMLFQNTSIVRSYLSFHLISCSRAASGASTSGARVLRFVAAAR